MCQHFANGCLWREWYSCRRNLLRLSKSRQADAILVSCPDGNHHLLIDSGDNC